MENLQNLQLKIKFIVMAKNCVYFKIFQDSQVKFPEIFDVAIRFLVNLLSVAEKDESCTKMELYNVA